ncbi:hypothetical protein [Enorma sp.]|uniref:hypothetical protein n=1 Tax=Enorma sp. TaxID=1920692 RepID=UPI0025C44715|nr:hypothetical protein [Enorma sp.]
MSPDDHELWREEIEFEFAYLAERGSKPGYAEGAERAIMERFVDEEAACDFRAA